MGVSGLDGRYLIAAVLLVANTIADGVLQTTETKPRILSLHVQSDIKFRFATTLVTSRVANPGHNATEAVFDVTLPNEAFISNFSMEIDGIVYPGEVKEKEEARRQYETARSRGQSAGHISDRPRETNKFVIEVNIAPESKVAFKLTYQELLKRNLGLYEQAIYINPGQIVEDLKVDVTIQESRDIRTLRVPPLRNDVVDLTAVTAVNSVADVNRPTPSSAYIRYYPTVEDQIAQSEQGNLGTFAVKYDVERNQDAGDVLVVDGYFVHFLAPEGMDPIPKDILFVLDVSGSMAGTKLQQLKSAMHIILDDLQEGDRFNILLFHTSTSMWKETLISVKGRMVSEAKRYVDELRDLYSTNINAALTEGVDFLLSNARDGERSPIMVFLTDGQATSGETNNDRILSNLRRANHESIPIFSMAFGHGSDFDLVKAVSAMNGGFARKIYEDADASLQITDFCDAISATLLKNIRFTYLADSVDIDSLTRHSFGNYYDGSEIIVAGKLSHSDVTTLNIIVDSQAVSGNLQMTLESDVGNNSFSQLTNLLEVDDLSSIAERVWSYLTIKQLIDGSTVEMNSTIRDENKNRALDLSLKYNFVTPLTSMVATLPNTSNDDAMVSVDIPNTPDRPRAIPMSGPYSSVAKSMPMPRMSSSSVQHSGFQPRTSDPFLRTGRPSGIPKRRRKQKKRLNSPGGYPMNPPDVYMSNFENVPMNIPSGRSIGVHVPRATRRPMSRPSTPRPKKDSSPKKKSRPGADDPAFMLTFGGVSSPLCFRSHPDIHVSSDAVEYRLYSTDGVEINASVAHPERRELELREIRVGVNSSILTFKPDDTTFEITNMATPHKNQTEFDGNILDTERTEDVVVHTLSLTTGMDIVIPSHKTPQGVWKLSLYIRNKGSATGEGILGSMLRYQILARVTGSRARLELINTTGRRDRARAKRRQIPKDLSSQLNTRFCWIVPRRYMKKFADN